MELKIKIRTGEGNVVFRHVEPGMNVSHKFLNKHDPVFGAHVHVRTSAICNTPPSQFMGQSVSVYPSSDPDTHAVVDCSIDYFDKNGSIDYVSFNSVEVKLSKKMKVAFIDGVDVDIE